MFGPISLYGLINLVVVFLVILFFYLVFIIVGENGGYRSNRLLIVGVALGVLAVTTIVVVSVYGHVLQEISDRIDGISTTVDAFPDTIKDCANATNIAETFNHHGIQATTKIAGTTLKIYEDVILTLLLSFTAITTLLFLLSSSPSIFSPRRRWRLFWFGMFWTLALEIICFIVMIFYDLIYNAQLVMKEAGGVVGEALDTCDTYWAAIVIYLEEPISQSCSDEIKAEMCKVHKALTGYTGSDLSGFKASSMSVAFLLPFLCIVLAGAVYFTWPREMLVTEGDEEDELVFRRVNKSSSRKKVRISEPPLVRLTNAEW